METINQGKPVLWLERLLRERNIDTKKLHEKAAELTRQKILLAAMEFFAAKGYQNTNIREIARKAGVTQGAVYHHFKDKKELLISMNRLRQVIALETMERALEQNEDFFKALRTALRELFGLLAEDAILKGVTREYMGMAMIDPDLKHMHSKNDIEFRDLYSEELKRRYPYLSSNRRHSLVHMILVAFEGLMTAVVVDSPMAEHPDQILDSFVDTFRGTVDGPDQEAT